jgi:hypothetical protein
MGGAWRAAMMERGWLRRLLWRRRGAWLWPVFVATVAVDAALGHYRPLAGDSESVAAAAIVGLAVNLLAVLLLSRPLGALLRRARADLPAVVARNYAGTSVVLAVTIVLLAVGLAHHATVTADQAAMRDATVRAEAWIGDHARDPEFRRNVRFSNTLVIQAGSIYRTCVPSQRSGRSYCVIVKTQLPFARSVSYAGSEPNSVFGEGVN